MTGRPRHPKKEVEEALEFAEAHGWLVKSPRPGHPWGKAMCEREGHDLSGVDLVDAASASQSCEADSAGDL